MTGCHFCAPSGLRQGQVLTPPPPPARHSGAEWTKPIQKYTTFTVFSILKKHKNAKRGGGGEMRHFCKFHHEFHNTTIPLTRNTFVECYFLSSRGGGGACLIGGCTSSASIKTRKKGIYFATRCVTRVSR